MKHILRIVRLSVGFSTFAFSPDRGKQRETSVIPERLFQSLSGQTSTFGIPFWVAVRKGICDGIFRIIYRINVFSQRNNHRKKVIFACSVTTETTTIGAQQPVKLRSKAPPISNEITAPLYIYPVGGHGWGLREDFTYYPQATALPVARLKNI